jgi:hypothetical protein
MIGIKGEVVYIGRASNGRLRDEIKAKRGTEAERGVKTFRCFCTDSDKVAKELEAEWIIAYEPVNNRPDE